MSTLKQITTKAKVLYKTGKYKKWTDAIKAASKTIKPKAVAKKKAAKKRTVSGWGKGSTWMYETNEKPKRGKKSIKVVRRKKAAPNNPNKKAGTFRQFSTICGIKSAAKKVFAEKLKTALYKKETAKLKRDKNKFAKEIREIKKLIKNYS